MEILMTTLRSVTLAVTGGIAAYKCCELVRGLKKAGIEMNRKSLSELAINDSAAFAALVDTAKKAL